MRKILTAALLASLLTASPAGADEMAEVLIVNGRDTLTLKSDAAVLYRNYFHQKCPLVLAAHESGNWVASQTGPEEACDVDAIDYRSYIARTLALCEGGERYGECWVVALGHEKVWEGRVRYRKGRWTPKTDRQFSLVLSAEPPGATSGRWRETTIGIATYRKDGRSADLKFLKTPAFGSCSGEIQLVPSEPAPFTISCSKMGKMSGVIDIGRDGRSGDGAGSIGGSRHVDLTILPQQDAMPAPKRPQIAERRPDS